MTDYDKLDYLLNNKYFEEKTFKHQTGESSRNIKGFKTKNGFEIKKIKYLANVIIAIKWKCLEYLENEYEEFQNFMNESCDVNGVFGLDLKTRSVEESIATAIEESNIDAKIGNLLYDFYQDINNFFIHRFDRRKEPSYQNSQILSENKNEYNQKSIELIKRAISELAKININALSSRTEKEFEKKLLESSNDDESNTCEKFINLDKKSLTHIPSNIDYCIGREDELKDIENKLKTDKKLLLLNGTGGIGKTTLAVEYLNKYEIFYNHIAFVEYNNGIKESFLNAFKYIYQEFNGDSVDERFNELFIELQNIKGKNILVVDDIKTEDNFNIIKDLSTKFDLLITSREKLEQINFLEIEHLHKDKAKELFILYYQTDKCIDKLLKYLDYHTLFIKLTAQSLKNSNELTIEKLENKFTNGEFGEVTNNLEKKTFNKYLNEFFNIDTLSKNEILILKKLSLFPSIEIKYEQLKDFLSVDDANEFDMDLNSLSNLGWLIKNNNSFKLHQVIRDFLLSNHHISYEESENIINIFSNKLDIQVTDNPIDKYEFIPYAISIVDNIDIKNSEIANLMNSISVTYQYMGDFKKALEYQEKSLEIKEDILDNKHSSLAQSYNNISMIYIAIGDSKKALEYQVKALEIQEETLDNKHPSLATGYNNISNIYRTMKNLDKALEYQIKALKIQEEVLDDNHPNLATSYNNISIIYRTMENLDKALEYQIKALKIQEEVLDDKHPNLAISYNNISIIYKDIGDLYEALEYQDKTLEIQEEILDNKHPDLAICYYNISLIFQDIGDLDKAKIYIDKAVNILQYNFSNGHPNLDVALNIQNEIYLQRSTLFGYRQFIL